MRKTMTDGIFGISKNPLYISQIEGLKEDIQSKYNKLNKRHYFAFALFVAYFAVYFVIALLGLGDIYVSTISDPKGAVLAAIIFFHVILFSLAVWTVSSFENYKFASKGFLQKLEPLPVERYVLLSEIIKEDSDLRDYVKKLKMNRDYLLVGEAEMMQKHACEQKKRQEKARKAEFEKDRGVKAKELIFE